MNGGVSMISGFGTSRKRERQYEAIPISVPPILYSELVMSMEA